jgi:hypothetical protein
VSAHAQHAPRCLDGLHTQSKHPQARTDLAGQQCDRARWSGRSADRTSRLEPRPRSPPWGKVGVDVQRQVRRLGPNSDGEELTPGVVADCFLGLLVDQPLAATLPTPGSLLVVGPGVLLDERVRQPDGRAVYDLVTSHPARIPRELVFLVDLAVELREWQATDWATLGVDVEGVAEAGVLLARRGQVPARWCHDLSAEEVKALGRPAMEYAREQLRARLAGRLSEQYLRWLHPSSERRPGEPFL